MKNKKKSGILAKVIIMLSFVLALFAGGYFFLDKFIVPKYFAKYDINGIGDLVGIVNSLYKNPKESKLITNGFTQTDLANGISKLQEKEYKIEDSGIVKKENFGTFKGTGEVELTDSEFAAICDKLLESEILESSFPDLRYLNLTKMTVLDFVIFPRASSYDEETNDYTAADIRFVIKLDTDGIREQIASQMDTPLYLLKMIIPDKLYFVLNYSVDLEKPAEERLSGTIAINGRTEKQSENLINLLVKFIFEEDDEMDMNKFTKEIGDVALKGIDMLGSFKFVKIEGSRHYGIRIE